MTGIPEPAVPPIGLCWFAVHRLPPLLAAFEKETEGVRAAEDIEYIHRMRVASRRLRAAHPQFRICFPPKQYNRWMREMGAITRALGEARDADVQIAFLVKYRKKRQAAWKARSHTENTGVSPFEPAIAYLLQDLQDQRKQYQSHVLSALASLEKSGVTGEMHAAFASRIATCRRTPVQALATGIPVLAAFRIASRLADMRSFEPWIPHADAVAEHHAMRIAAKKLRYTMEVYGPVYRLGLQKPLARVKKVQEILGDLHDCDVWIDHVTRLLLRERGHLRSQARENRPDTATLASLRLFLTDRERERIILHRHFMRYWESLARTNIWDDLRHTLACGRKKQFIPSKEWSDQEIRAACEQLSASFPKEHAHHCTVTRLALMLFDSLRSLHTFTPHERLLLECAGMLHDTGEGEGSRRHTVRSFRKILSEESLLLDMADRSAIALITLACSRKARIESHPLFLLWQPSRQDMVLHLASLIRIADALDFRHTGIVQEIHCVTENNAVTCTLITTGDAAREKERAQARVELFARAFGREMVIR